MADAMKPSARSALMSRIRAKHTTPEKSVRSMLWRDGFRFRLHAKKLAGRPDIVLPKWASVVFVNGCFWHCHENCRLFRLPGTRPEFWLQKLSANRARDERTVQALQELGWRVAVVWECALREDAAGLQVALARWVRGDLKFTQFSGRGGRLVVGTLPPAREG